MSTIGSMENMPRKCSCGAYPVVEFLPHPVQWRVECPQCGRAGAASDRIEGAVAEWNHPGAHLLAGIGATTANARAGMAAAR